MGLVSAMPNVMIKLVTYKLFKRVPTRKSQDEIVFLILFAAADDKQIAFD